MKLLEKFNTGKSIKETIREIIDEIFGVKLGDDALNKIVDNLGLSDLLSLDSAYEQNDTEAIKNIIEPTIQLEYSIRNTKPVSQASNRPKPQMRQPIQKPAQGNSDNSDTKPKYKTGIQGKTNNQADDDSDDEENDTNNNQKSNIKVKENNLDKVLGKLKINAGLRQ